MAFIRRRLRAAWLGVGGGTGAGVDDLLIDDNGDHLLIDDTNSDARKIED